MFYSNSLKYHILHNEKIFQTVKKGHQIQIS